MSSQNFSKRNSISNLCEIVSKIRVVNETLSLIKLKRERESYNFRREFLDRRVKMPRKKRKKEKRKSISKISNEIESSERQR